MSGFAPDWLRLRESADHRARDPKLLARLAACFAGRDAVTVVDLGAGLGSNLRATALALPVRQHWTLADHDPVLLAAASDTVATWADTARATMTGIEAVKAGRILRVELKRHDLAAEPAAWGETTPDLVTAAALFDLVSESWIDRFVVPLTSAQLPLYAALTHDGKTEWMPAYTADDAMGAAFARHFARDKGFGPSAGASASNVLAQRLTAAGYDIDRASSPWRLGRGDRALIAALAEGWAAAVRETGEVPARTVAEWLEARKADGVSCTVGHEDLLALPPTNDRRAPAAAYAGARRP
jgi:hypothetical protein